MKDNINYEAPDDWGVSSKTDWVSHSELTDNGAPALEGRDVVGFIEFGQIKLAPGKPPGATSWRAVDHRPVQLDPSTKRWKYVQTKPKQTKPKQGVAERMAKGFEKAKAEGKIPEQSLDEEAMDSKSVKNQTKEINKRKQNKPTKEQEQREFNKKGYLSEMVKAIMADTSAGKGAGKYELSRDDMETYLQYLDGKKPTIPSYEISEEDVDEVISQIKGVVGKGKPYAQFAAKLGRKGDPPKSLVNMARGRSVLQHYLSTGGISAITGQRIPFSDSQLDHRLSLDNGGVDGPDNWEWVEARFNQFKQAFTDETVREKLKTNLAKSPLEDKRKALQNEIKNLSRSSYKSHFSANGFGGVSLEDINEAKGSNGEQFLKAMAEVAGVSRYQEGAQRESGRAGGGRFIGYPALKQKLIEKIQPLSREKITKVDEGLSKISSQIREKEGQVKDISSEIRKEKAEARKKAKANMTEMDYLELIKLSRNPEYADSMVYYRGKALGRCPAGTTKVGRTCAPVQKEGPGSKYKKNVLGGLSKQQVARLAKAKSTEQIIEAHKEKEKTDD